MLAKFVLWRQIWIGISRIKWIIYVNQLNTLKISLKSVQWFTTYFAKSTNKPTDTSKNIISQPSSSGENDPDPSYRLTTIYLCTYPSISVDRQPSVRIHFLLRSITNAPSIMSIMCHPKEGNGASFAKCSDVPVWQNTRRQSREEKLQNWGRRQPEMKTGMEG